MKDSSGCYEMTNDCKTRSSWPSHIQGSVEQWVNGKSQSMSASRVANGDGKWINQFCKKQCHVWCFIVLFTFLVHFWMLICKSDPCSHYLCVLALTCPLVENFRTLQIFVWLEQCTSYWGPRQILSRGQHAPNKRCALNNDVRLATRFYGSFSLGSCVNRKEVLYYYIAWKSEPFFQWYYIT